MTTGLQISNGTDFDSLFQTGSGTQLLYTYANNGADIGQRYLPASSGSAYGNTGFYNPSGTDVGNLLCKAGTNYHVTMTVGTYSTSKGSCYGYSRNGMGSLNRMPYWNGNQLCSLAYNGTSNGIVGSMYSSAEAGYTACYIKNNGYSTIYVNGIAFTRSAGSSVTIDDVYLPNAKGDVLGLSSKAGQTITLTFSPAPTSYG